MQHLGKAIVKILQGLPLALEGKQHKHKTEAPWGPQPRTSESLHLSGKARCGCHPQGHNWHWPVLILLGKHQETFLLPEKYILAVPPNI